MLLRVYRNPMAAPGVSLLLLMQEIKLVKQGITKVGDLMRKRSCLSQPEGVVRRTANSRPSSASERRIRLLKPCWCR